MIQERVRQNLKGSGRVGEGGFPLHAAYMDCTDCLKCSILQHFLAKMDARKGDDLNRGAIQSLQEI